MAGRKYSSAKTPMMRSGYAAIGEGKALIMDETCERLVDANLRSALRSIKRKIKLPGTTLGQLTNLVNSLIPIKVLLQQSPKNGPMTADELMTMLMEVKRLEAAKAREDAPDEHPIRDITPGISAEQEAETSPGDAAAAPELPRRALPPRGDGRSGNLH
jgi:hypothetical protein